MNEIPAAICAENLTKTYGNVRALHGVTTSVRQGEIVALLGPNGAGKTTFVDLLLGLQKPTAGKSQILGMSSAEAIRRCLIGVVNQTGGLPVDMKVSQALSLFGSFYSRPLPSARLLEITKLGGLSNRRIGKLSGGERQRVRLALALQSDPNVLILDEPTTGMDTTARAEFWEVMGQEATLGRTIVFATHYLAEAEQFAKRSIIMSEGQIIADGATDILKQGNRILRVRFDEVVLGEIQREMFARGWLPDILGDQLILSCDDTDEAARILLGMPGTHSLEITAPSLEQVFTEMVGNGR